MQLFRHVLVLLCLTFAAFCATARPAGSQQPIAHDVAAPASDVLAGVVRLPDPAASPERSQAAIVELAFEPEVDPSGARRWRADVELPVDRAGDVVLALLGPDAGAIEVAIDAPGAVVATRRIEPAGDALPGWSVDRRDLARVPAGPLRVTLLAARSPASTWLVLRSAGELALEAWPSSALEVADAAPAVLARLSGPDARVRRASVAFFCAGVRATVLLSDDGEHADGAAGDGTFGAFVPAEMRGQVFARVEIEAEHASGSTSIRSALLSFPVIDRTLFFGGAAAAHALGDGRIAIELEAFAQAPARATELAAELWGAGADGARAPVCWLSRVVSARELEEGARDGTWRLPLVLDPDWISFAGARAPFELRAVRARDVESGALVERADRIALELPEIAPRHVTRPTARMLCGREDATIGGYVNATPSLFAPALMLVHGYCSSGSIWPAADFTQPKLEFLDPNANRTHDQFAQLLAQRAQQAGLSSFGVAAHSQGGPAALHLFAHYQSGLDLATGGRRIQALASPWLGTPLASLGAFACGVNNDMTPNGSAAWLAGIPSWARAEVYAWTTSNSGSVCNALTNLFLGSPNDGTVEKFRGELPGGNNLGHTLGWCHTTGMSNPASYTDHVRNHAIDAAAAR